MATPNLPPTIYATTPRCHLLSPATEDYPDRGHAMAHVHVAAHAVLVVTVPEAVYLSILSGFCHASCAKQCFSHSG